VVGQQNADIVDTLHPRDVAMATIFGFLYRGAHWRHQLANTTEPSMCGGDAALCQITLTMHLFYYCTVCCSTSYGGINVFKEEETTAAEYNGLPYSAAIINNTHR